MRAKRFVFAVVAGLMAISAWAATRAQDVPAGAAFEVVSIKHVLDSSPFPPLRITARGQLVGRGSLRTIIQLAYGAEPYERIVVGESRESHYLEEGFEVHALPAQAASPPGREDVRAMSRQMLAERFRLKVRMDTELARATVLRTVKPGVFGRGLRPAPEGCSPLPTGAVPSDPKFDDAYQRNCFLTFFGNRIRGTATLDEFVRLLSVGAQHPFLNRTDLEGPFAIDIAVATASWFTAMPFRDNEGPALLDALRNQMGLTARTERHAIRLFVVEHVESLIEN